MAKLSPGTTATSNRAAAKAGTKFPKVTQKGYGTGKGVISSSSSHTQAGFGNPKAKGGKLPKPSSTRRK